LVAAGAQRGAKTASSRQPETRDATRSALPTAATKTRAVRRRTIANDQDAAQARGKQIERLRQLPTMRVEDAAFVLGISRAAAYAAVDGGEIKVKKIGRRKLVLTRPLFAELGY